MSRTDQIDIARRLIATGISKDLVEVLEQQFPELAESEDERFRKYILKCCEQTIKADVLGLEISMDTTKKLKAFLEKWKDASKAIEAVERINKYIDEQVVNADDMQDSNPDKVYYRGWNGALSIIARILQDVYSGEKQKSAVLSDDERIRQAIVELVKWVKAQQVHTDHFDNGIKWNQMLAFLEKQKEQKSLPLDLSIEDVETIKTALLESGLEFTSNQKVYDKLEKLPASAYYLSTVGHSKIYPDGTVERHRLGYLEKQKEQKSIEDVVKDITKNKESAIKFLKSAGIMDDNGELAEMYRSESKPAEWSEEDDMLMDELESYILYDEEFNDEQKSWRIKRLKSLRPQSHTISKKDAIKFGNLEYERGVKDGIQSEKNRHWKPSEEELVTLKRVGCMLRDYGHSELAKEVFMIEGKLTNLPIANKSTWKPSEEQMEAFHSAIASKAVIRDAKTQNQLEGLYNDLLTLQNE